MDTEMANPFKLIAIVFFLLFFNCSASFAATYVVRVQQVSPKGETQRATCSDNNECRLSIVIESASQKKEPLIVRVNFVPGSVTFKFQVPTGYLYVGGKKGASNPVWYKALGQDIKVNETVTLYGPTNSSINQSLILSAHTDAIADFQIKIARSS